MRTSAAGKGLQVALLRVLPGERLRSIDRFADELGTAFEADGRIDVSTFLPPRGRSPHISGLRHQAARHIVYPAAVRSSPQTFSTSSTRATATYSATYQPSGRS